MVMASLVLAGTASAQTSHFKNDSRGAFAVWSGVTGNETVPFYDATVNIGHESGV
jgi:hypothetical protein